MIFMFNACSDPQACKHVQMKYEENKEGEVDTSGFALQKNSQSK